MNEQNQERRACPNWIKHFVGSLYAPISYEIQWLDDDGKWRTQIACDDPCSRLEAWESLRKESISEGDWMQGSEWRYADVKRSVRKTNRKFIPNVKGWDDE